MLTFSNHLTLSSIVITTDQHRSQFKSYTNSDDPKVIPAMQIDDCLYKSCFIRITHAKTSFLDSLKQFSLEYMINFRNMLALYTTI